MPFTLQIVQKIMQLENKWCPRCDDDITLISWGWMARGNMNPRELKIGRLALVFKHKGMGDSWVM